MAGGNRAYTLQDVLGQLNQDSAQGQTDGAGLQINQMSGVFDTVKAVDAVTTATGGVSFYWNAAAMYWGSQAWGFSSLDGGTAASTFTVTDVDGGNAASTYPTTGNFDGGGA